MKQVENDDLYMSMARGVPVGFIAEAHLWQSWQANGFEVTFFRNRISIESKFGLWPDWARHYFDILDSYVSNFVFFFVRSRRRSSCHVEQNGVFVSPTHRMGPDRWQQQPQQEG